MHSTVKISIQNVKQTCVKRPHNSQTLHTNQRIISSTISKLSIQTLITSHTQHFTMLYLYIIYPTFNRSMNKQLNLPFEPFSKITDENNHTITSQFHEIPYLNINNKRSSKTSQNVFIQQVQSLYSDQLSDKHNIKIITNTLQIGVYFEKLKYDVEIDGFLKIK